MVSIVLQVQEIRGAKLTVNNSYMARKIKIELLTQLNTNTGRIKGNIYRILSQLAAPSPVFVAQH